MKEIEKDLKHWKAKFKIARVGNVPKDYYLATGMCDGLSLALKRINEKNNKQMQFDKKLGNFSCKCGWLHLKVHPGFRCKCGEVFNA